MIDAVLMGGGAGATLLMAMVSMLQAFGVGMNAEKERKKREAAGEKEAKMAPGSGFHVLGWLVVSGFLFGSGAVLFAAAISKLW